MSAILEELGTTELRASVQAAVRSISLDGALETSLAAESIRVALSIDLKAGAVALHLTNRVRAALEAFGGNSVLAQAPKFPITLLRSMRRLGDVQENDSIYLPSPFRFINITPRSTFALVIGSKPTQLVEQQLGTPVRVYSASRYVLRSGLPREVRYDDSRWQALGDWLGTPEPRLDLWAEQTIARAMQSSELGPPLGASRVEVYLPEISENKRWLAVETIRAISSEPQLCRAMFPGLLRPRYFVGILRKSTAGREVSRSGLLQPSVGERLMYGIDSLRAVPFFFSLERSSTGFVSLVRPRVLPKPESKILAIGHRHGSDRVFVYPTELCDLLEATFLSLGSRTKLIEKWAAV